MSTSSDRVKHLEFIQATIARQASHSFAIKGWSITVSAIIYAYAASNLTWWLAIVSLMPPVVFACLDGFYLRQERLFRELYRDAIRAESSVPVFDMNTRKYQDRKSFPDCSYRSLWKAPTWGALHATILSIGLLLLGIAIF